MGNCLTDKELAHLISLSRRVLWSPPEIRKKLQDNKINIVPANFYSNIPLVEDVENSFEYKDTECQVYNNGLFDRDNIVDFIDKISGYSGEFTPPADGDFAHPAEFFWNNPAFSGSDAMAYYCVLRHFKPDHILEVGSGFSTLVADQAIKKNGKGRITIIEPYPKEFLRGLESVESIIETFAQDIPVADFVKLVESAQIWFIDSTHTVKIGSDCLYIYLKVMPEISKDIIVHTHDVCLPFGMPPEKALEKHIYWTEQYLLYAYMVDNPKIEVLFGSTYAERVIPKTLENMMLSQYIGAGGSLWYKVNGESANTSLYRKKC